jgi:regulatory protein
VNAQGSRQADDVGKAFAFILRATRHRPQTEAEVRARLAAREVPEGVAEAALARARDVGAVNDAAFARAWVEDRGRQRGYGLPRLRDELRRRLVPEPLIADALVTLEERDDLAVATDLARARLRQLPASLPPETVARRLHGFLARRGYPPGLAQRVAGEVSGLDRQWD